MESYITSLLNWAQSHPQWATAIIFVVAMAESLVIVGVLVPGALMMLGAGALIALGVLDFWTTFLAAVAGAIVGDGLSYLIGYFYKDQLRQLWPFSRYPTMIQRGEDYFRRHGGKSVFLGRFVGPVRAVIPTVAGMMNMTPPHFFLVNVLSAIAWAPTYLVPGMVFGASLSLASEVATRLGILLLGFIFALWLMTWLVRQVFNFTQPRAQAGLASMQKWSNRYPPLGNIVTAILDPARPEARALAMLAALLTATVWAFLELVEQLLSGATLGRIDSSVFHFLQSLRTPWADQVMVLISQLGDSVVNVPLVLGLALWLSWQRQWLAVGHWLAAAAFGGFATVIIKQALQIPRPTQIYEGLVTYAFPSGHVTLSTVLYGFLAVLIASDMTPSRRWLPYAAVAPIITAVAVSRLYLGAHWLSDVLGGLMLGIAGVALLGIAYRRHLRSTPDAHQIVAIAALLVAIAGTWHIAEHHQREMIKYQVRENYKYLSEQQWWAGGWQTLPAFRIDFGGDYEQPLTLQWPGDIKEIRNYFKRQGWQEPRRLTLASTLNWLRPQPSFSELPVLPRAHDGRHEALVLTHTAPSSQQQLVLRLWPTQTRLTPAQPLWIGNVSLQRMKPILLFTLPHDESSIRESMAIFKNYLSDTIWKQNIRDIAPGINDSEKGDWDRTVFIIRAIKETQ